MDAKQLLFFKHTVELGSMTRAAEKLLVSQPYLSRIIAGLEGKVDFAICVPPQESCAELMSMELRLEPGALIYPPGHWLENHEEIGFNEIRDEAFISGSRGYGKSFFI